MDPLFGKAKKVYALRFYQLKVGHGAIGTFLKRIKAAKTAECWWCRAAKESVIYLYTKCRKWQAKCQALKKNLRNEAKIQWQRWRKKKWLAELLANRHAVGPLLNF